MRARSRFQTDPFWIAISVIFFTLAFSAHILIQLTGGYSPGSYWDMIPHFLFGAAICALLLNFNLSRSLKKLIPVIPPLLLVILPAIFYTIAVGFTWEIIEEIFEQFFPWLGYYSDFWWNGIRDILMDFLGALLATGLYLWHFPMQASKVAKELRGAKIVPTGYIPGKIAMVYCDSCGSTIPPDSRHCPNCGEKI